MVDEGSAQIRTAIEGFEGGDLGNANCTAEYTLASAEQAKEAAATVASLMDEFYASQGTTTLQASTLLKIPLL